MTDESRVLCLYAGGTIGMVRQDANGGFAPYPSFLTETLRSQSRFHDPHADSIFSWSDSVDRYKTWSETYTRPLSGATTPSVKRSPILQDGIHESKPHPHPHPHSHLHHLYSDTSAGLGQAAHAQVSAALDGTISTIGAPLFGKPVLVRSSAPQGTSTHHTISSQMSSDGSCLELQLPTLITPRISNGKRVRYAVLEYDPLLDSSEMDIPDWIRMAKDISLNYQDFDSFIVLHGTDTMAYTSSALSMLLENLGKTVIVTGAQVPLSELRNDAIENVLGALMIAGSYIIPEVCLYFASTLFRGNRTSKVSNNALAAFSSPNMPPLAQVGINIDVSWNLVERSRVLLPLRAHDKMSPNVALLRLFPGLHTSTVKSFLSPPLRGVVLESYGAGNAPSREDLLNVFREASLRGVVIVNITQCIQGEVSAIYAVGKKLEAVGVVAGGDMTPECALAKLSYLLGKEELNPQQVRELMAQSLRGELTNHRVLSPPPSSLINNDTVESNPTSMLGGPEPSPSGISKTDMKTLIAHILKNPSQAQNFASLFSSSSSSNSTASSVSPQVAAAWDQSDLQVSQAALTVLPYLIYEAASNNDVSMLQWHLSALSSLESIPILSITDEDPSSISTSGSTSRRRSSLPAPSTSLIISESNSTTAIPPTNPIEKLQPLHISCSKGYFSIVETLLQAGCSVHSRHTISGHTPLFLAAQNGHLIVVKLLRIAGAHLKQDEFDLVSFLRSRSCQNLDDVSRSKQDQVWLAAGCSLE